MSNELIFCVANFENKFSIWQETKNPEKFRFSFSLFAPLVIYVGIFFNGPNFYCWICVGDFDWLWGVTTAEAMVRRMVVPKAKPIKKIHYNFLPIFFIDEFLKRSKDILMFITIECFPFFHLSVINFSRACACLYLCCKYLIWKGFIVEMTCPIRLTEMTIGKEFLFLDAGFFYIFSEFLGSHQVRLVTNCLAYFVTFLALLIEIRANDVTSQFTNHQASPLAIDRRE